MGQFTFVDLFAGIGGFHAALSGLGGECVLASEIDRDASRVYELNWGPSLAASGGRLVGDINRIADDRGVDVPPHDVLTAGFPCQPFSKSGFQRGTGEARGTLFWNILRILEERRPSLILLENVRNLAGPRHRDTWDTIVRLLREIGYRVSSEPTVFSPHLLPPRLGGRPQIRDRVFIAGVFVGPERARVETDDPPVVPYASIDGWDPGSWDLERDILQADSEVQAIERYRLSAVERQWISAWEEFVQEVTAERGSRLPGFPIWADCFVHPSALTIPDGTPAWKEGFLRKNSALYAEHRRTIDRWLARHGGLAEFPPSRRKLEWQAQDTESLWDTIIHFRPSGIRAKRPTYVPALVAITQTSVVAGRGRRITPREAARLQGLPDSFTFGDQPDAASYKQLGNGVNVGVAAFILREFAESLGRSFKPSLPAELVEPSVGLEYSTSTGRHVGIPTDDQRPCMVPLA